MRVWFAVQFTSFLYKSSKVFIDSLRLMIPLILKCIVFYRSFIFQGVLVSLVCDIISKFLFDMTKLLNMRVNEFILAAMNYETAGTMIYCRIQLFVLLTLMVFYKQVFYINIWFEMGGGGFSVVIWIAHPMRNQYALPWSYIGPL